MTELLPVVQPVVQPADSLGARLRVPTDDDAYAWHRAFDDTEVMEFHGGRPAELSVYQEFTALPQALGFA